MREPQPLPDTDCPPGSSAPAGTQAGTEDAAAQAGTEDAGYGQLLTGPRPLFDDAPTALAWWTERQQGVPVGHLAVHRWYLERPPGVPDPLPAPVTGAMVQRLQDPTPEAYLELYGGVGGDWLWYERRRWERARLAATLGDPAVAVYRLQVDGQTGGYYELVAARDPGGTVELAYFGLFAAQVGRRLGPWLLNHAIRTAQADGPARLSVNTCSLDHPAALGAYRGAGFEVVRQTAFHHPDPRLSGILPRDVAPHVPLARG